MGRRLKRREQPGVEGVAIFTPPRWDKICRRKTLCLSACGEALVVRASYFESWSVVDSPKGKCLLLLCERQRFDQTRRRMGC